MSYIPYNTATQWKAYYAALNDGPSDQIKIAIDTLGAIENNGGGGGGVSTLTFTTDGTSTFTSATLIGKTIQAIILPVLLDVAEYSQPNGSGTITWTNAPDTGLEGLIIYS